MNLFKKIKELVSLEKNYTAKILRHLVTIEKDKLYCDLKYNSLHKYIVKELGYSDSEATVRVNAVRLMMKSKTAVKKIESGKLTLTNACEANRLLEDLKDEKQIEKVIEKAVEKSTRGFKKFIEEEYKVERKETIVINEEMTKKFDRLRIKYGDLSTYELINIMLEKELRGKASANVALQRLRPCSAKNSRSIPKRVKAQVYTGECANCGTKHNLEYDHIEKYSHGGDNSARNIQILCRNCNQRKEIQAKQTNFFG